MHMTEEKVGMQYEIEGGSVHHALRVLGVGVCDRNPDYFCVSNNSFILPGTDHVWSEIARSVVQQPMLRATLPTAVTDSVPATAKASDEASHVEQTLTPVVLAPPVALPVPLSAPQQSVSQSVPQPVLEQSVSQPVSQQPVSQSVPQQSVSQQSVSQPVPEQSVPQESEPKQPTPKQPTPKQPTRFGPMRKLTAGGPGSMPRPPRQPPQPLRPAQSDPLDLSLIPSADSVPAADEQLEYVDIRDKTFVNLNATGTGTFRIYDTASKQARGSIQYANFQKNGLYEEFYDASGKHPKVRGYYRNGEKHGQFTVFYDMPGSPINCQRNYDTGMLEGWFVQYDRFGQVQCSILYGHGVERRRVEYRPDGRIYRVVECPKGVRESLVTIAEINDKSYVQYIGQAQCKKRNKKYEYSYHGLGTLFFDFLASLHVQWANGFAVVGAHRVSAVDCLNCVRVGKSVKVKPTQSGVSVPWKILPIQGSDTLKVTIDGTDWVVRERKKVKVGKESGTETTLFSPFGYVIKKVLATGDKTTYTEYYPLPGNGEDLVVDGVAINASVKGLIEKPIIRSITVAQGNKTILQEKFMNTGVKIRRWGVGWNKQAVLSILRMMLMKRHFFKISMFRI